MGLGVFIMQKFSFLQKMNENICHMCLEITDKKEKELTSAT